MAEKTKTIGIMGGGQLGLMIVEQAHLLGARTLCLDPAPDAPAFALSDGHIVAAYDDAAALEELCRPCTPPWTTRRRCVPPWPR